MDDFENNLNYILSIENDFPSIHKALFEYLLSVDDSIKIPFLDRFDETINIIIKLSLSPQLRRQHITFITASLLKKFKNVSCEEFIIRILPFIDTSKTAYSFADQLTSDEYIIQSLKFINNNIYQLKLLTKVKNVQLIIKTIKAYFFTDYEVFQAFKKINDKNIKIALSHQLFNVKPLPQKLKISLPSFLDSLPKELQFGTEIECLGDKSYGILLTYQKLCGYDVKEELSIPNQGIEFSSPKLSWTASDLLTIYKICDFAKQNELYTNDLCGGHIHFSSDFLNTLDEWYWFLYLYTKFEFILYLISNPPGSLPRNEILNYAKPFSDCYIDNLWRLNSIHNMHDFIINLKNISGKKQTGINFSNIFERFNTIEFRIPNSSLDPKVILENILLFGNLLVMSKKLAKLSSTKDTYELLNKLDSVTNYETTLDLMLKLLFKDEVLRQIFKKRFYTNYKAYLQTHYPNNLESKSIGYQHKKISIII